MSAILLAQATHTYDMFNGIFLVSNGLDKN